MPGGAGKSKPTMRAIAPAMTSTCHTATASLPSRAARRARRDAMTREVAMISRRRSTRSRDDPAGEGRHDGGDRGGGAQEPELQGRAAQLEDEPALAHDQQLERPHRGDRAKPVAPERRHAERRETRAEPRSYPPPPHGSPGAEGTRSGGRSRLCSGSPRSSRRRLSAITVQRRSSSPSLQPDACGVITTLARVSNG